MHVICPKCFTRYNIPDEDLSQDRVLKCSKCSHKWHYQPPVVFSAQPQELKLSETHFKEIDDHIHHQFQKNFSKELEAYKEPLKKEISDHINTNLITENTALKQALTKNQSLASKLVMILFFNITVFIALLILYIYYFSY